MGSKYDSLWGLLDELSYSFFGPSVEDTYDGGYDKKDPSEDDLYRAELLLELARWACERVELLEQTCPHLVRRVAGTKLSWPILAYATQDRKNSSKRDGPQNKRIEFERRINALKLGMSLPVHYNPMHDEFNLVILDFVQRRYLEKSGPEPALYTLESLRKEYEGWGVDSSNLSQFDLDLHNEIASKELRKYKLPKLTKKTARIWAEAIVLDEVEVPGIESFIDQRGNVVYRVAYPSLHNSICRKLEAVRASDLKEASNALSRGPSKKEVAESWEEKAETVQRSIESGRFEKSYVLAEVESRIQGLIK
ncbi:hypothetical protein [Pelagicoccus mobilis]|uniref:Uncharacterized protein n=1 Tax=Pelagicoccus mobilis TaxID=415221 RepID=A0A934S039_9BACT|nr:hypothetical protein [Pelagicoccus mobilis]MBK1878534.1 hypothetical protein [Pelagicoccus mobilis]